MEANGQCHAAAALSPLPIKYEAGRVSNSMEKKMVPTPGIETLFLGEQSMARVMYRICGDVHMLRVWPPFTP
jgi:hypothetical protein